MKNSKNEKRVVNLLKEDFDTIKDYCDKNALSMPKWLTQIAITEVGGKTIKIERSFFEHLLNCLCNQKFIRQINADALECDYKKIQQENQQIIDKAWRDGMDALMRG